MVIPINPRICYTGSALKIAILGGSFNPVHKGHIFLAETVVERLGYGLVVLVPAYISPFKQNGADGAAVLKRQAEDRLALLLAAAAGKRRLAIDDCELRREGVSYTVDTVADIVERYRPDGRPGLIIGDDLVADFPRWRRADEIAERCDLIVANRISGGVPVPFPHIRLENAVMPVSSSMVREMMAQGNDWRVLVPDEGGDSAEAVIEAKVCAMLPVGRFLHSRNVALMAVMLAQRFGISEDDAYLAGITHDMAKELSTPLGHGEMAAAMLAEQCGVTNKDILEAVSCHTEGKIGMGNLAKIIYIADKVEPRRRTVEPRLREMCKTLPLDGLFREIVRGTHLYLEQNGVSVSANARLLLRRLEKNGDEP
jgi:nicotinate-nucleotide adenylyltransferase